MQVRIFKQQGNKRLLVVQRTRMGEGPTVMANQVNSKDVQATLERDVPLVARKELPVGPR